MLPVGLLLKCFNLGMEGCNLLLFLARDVPLVVEHPSVMFLLSLRHQSFCSEIRSFITLFLELLDIVDKLLIFTCLVSLEEIGDVIRGLLSMVGKLGWLIPCTLIECSDVILGWVDDADIKRTTLTRAHVSSSAFDRSSLR